MISGNTHLENLKMDGRPHWDRQKRVEGGEVDVINSETCPLAGFDTSGL
jgi:hypothetical protein